MSGAAILAIAFIGLLIMSVAVSIRRADDRRAKAAATWALELREHPCQICTRAPSGDECAGCRREICSACIGVSWASGFMSLCRSCTREVGRDTVRRTGYSRPGGDA